MTYYTMTWAKEGSCLGTVWSSTVVVYAAVLYASTIVGRINTDTRVRGREGAALAELGHRALNFRLYDNTNTI